jgi:hypothetical protein
MKVNFSRSFTFVRAVLTLAVFVKVDKSIALPAFRALELSNTYSIHDTHTALTSLV